jgi:CopG family nickel-responsive transcriptional regulator
MEPIARFGISINQNLIDSFDKSSAKKGYLNRSEAIRDLIRDHLVEEEWAGNKPVVGTITLVYDHDVRELGEVLAHLQHRHHRLIRSTVHIHLDEHHCLEVLVVIGRSGVVKKVADRLIGTKGVKHGKLVMTTTGKELK